MYNKVMRWDEMRWEQKAVQTIIQIHLSELMGAHIREVTDK